MIEEVESDWSSSLTNLPVPKKLCFELTFALSFSFSHSSIAISIDIGILLLPSVEQVQLTIIIEFRRSEAKENEIETMTAVFVFVLTILVFGARATSAFVTSHNAIDITTSARSTSLRMIGGRGWDNQDYLSGLSGDDEDRAKAKEDYNDFSERRAAFHERQAEIMKTPQGQAFLKQRQEQEFQNLQEEQNMFGEDGLPSEEFEVGSGGGTRMSRMMAQAKRMQGRRGGGPSAMIGGLGQQLLGPLDDEEEEK